LAPEKHPSRYSAAAYYIARFVVSKFAFGMFLLFAAAVLDHDFGFTWLFLAFGLAGGLLVVFDLKQNFDTVCTFWPTMAQRLPERLTPTMRGWFGAILALAAAFAYLYQGFTAVIFICWAVGLTVYASAFFKRPNPFWQRFARSDVVAISALYALSLPIYLWSVYTFPLRLNSDESVLLCAEQQYVGKGLVDIFGLSDYFGFQLFPFLLQGWLAQALGGVDLYHVRLLNALTGTIIVACSYVFFRSLGLKWPLAACGTLFVCFNHSLIVISRIASRTNGGLLVEILTLTCLYVGFQKKSNFATCIGGLFAAVAFNVYYSARLVLPIWLLFLLLLVRFKPGFYTRTELVRLGCVFVTSFTLCVAPLVAGLLREPQFAQDAMNYQSGTCLLFAQGRLFATDRWGKDGIAHCITSGLTVFNNTVEDQAYIYPNKGNGFVDPISGVLLWLGVIRVFSTFRGKPAAILMLSGFFFEYLAYALLTFPSPNYTRCLVMLPFAGYFVARAIGSLGWAGTKIVASRKWLHWRNCHRALMVSFCLAIIFANLKALFEFAPSNEFGGRDLGTTARYLECQKQIPGHLFVVVVDVDHPYFQRLSLVDDYVPTCYSNTQPYISTNQDLKLFTPQDLDTVQLSPPFSILMNGDVWKDKGIKLQQKYPLLTMHAIDPEDDLIVCESINPKINFHNTKARFKQWDEYPDLMANAVANNNNEEAERLGLSFLNAALSSINGSYLKSQILAWLGTAQVRLNKYKDAEDALREAYGIKLQMRGARSYDTATVSRSLGDLFFARRDWNESERWYQTSIASKEAFAKDNSVSWVAGLPYDFRRLAEAQKHNNNFAAAEQSYRRAMNLCRDNETETSYKKEIEVDLAAMKKEWRKQTSPSSNDKPNVANH